MARIISTLADVEEGLAVLSGRDPRLAPLRRRAGDVPLRRAEGGFSGLLRIIVSQQVSVASAAAIWSRTYAVFEPMSPETILSATDEDFRRAGLSRPKIRTMRAVAAAVAGGLDLAALAGHEADAAHAALVAIKGIGPWTADIYLMFCLGHADAFAAGDLALQEAARLAFDLPARPSAADLAALSEAWRPWRSVAARLLWAYYRELKAGRETAPLPAGETR